MHRIRQGLKSLERLLRRARDHSLPPVLLHLLQKLDQPRRDRREERRRRNARCQRPDKPSPGLSWSQAVRVIASLRRKPKLSIIVPVYRGELRSLDRCIRSLIQQFYPNWELILVGDGGNDPVWSRRMQAWAERDRRIIHAAVPPNRSPAAGLNHALSLASGPWVGFLGHADELPPDALAWVAAMHNRHPEAAWFYSDEDQLDQRGQRHTPFFKPDFSPEYLLACGFTCRFTVYARSVLREVGGFRAGFDGAEDHDLALRIAEAVPRDRVIHIPRILYHRRQPEDGAATAADGRSPAVIAGRAAIAEALARRGIRGDVTPHPRSATLYRTRLVPRTHPAVTVIIPTRDAFDDLRACLDSLRRFTRYPRYRILVIDNQSQDADLLRYLTRESDANRLEVLPYPHRFNHSAMNNLAVEQCDSEWVVLMNNDVQVLTPDWLETLIATTELDPAIAGVGALLLYADGQVQHGGILLGAHGLAGHMHRHCPPDDPGYFGRAHALQEVSAATAALLLVRRSAFVQAGGFDAETFPTSFNDVDLWLRLRAAGYRCVYNPEVRALHYETKTRRTALQEELEFQRRFVERWGDLLQGDPFYNPNLALDNEQFQGYREYPLQLPEFGESRARPLQPARGQRWIAPEPRAKAA